MRSFALAFLTSLLLSLVLACTPATFVVQQYPGPVRPPESIATIRVNGNDTVRLLLLDDQDVAAPIASDGRLHIEILPGKHTLSARRGDDLTTPITDVVLEAAPGKVYRFLFAAGALRLYEVERGSDTPIREISGRLASRR